MIVNQPQKESIKFNCNMRDDKAEIPVENMAVRNIDQNLDHNLQKISEEIKLKLIEGEEKIKNREEHCERINFYDFEQPIAEENFEDKKEEIKAVIKNIMIDKVDHIEEVKPAEHFSGSLKILRKDGHIEEKVVENELLISSEVIDKTNNKQILLFTSKGMNPVVEIKHNLSETNIEEVEEQTTKMLTTLSNEKGKNYNSQIVYLIILI